MCEIFKYINYTEADTLAPSDVWDSTAQTESHRWKSAASS